MGNDYRSLWNFKIGVIKLFFVFIVYEMGLVLVWSCVEGKCGIYDGWVLRRHHQPVIKWRSFAETSVFSITDFFEDYWGKVWMNEGKTLVLQSRTCLEWWHDHGIQTQLKHMKWSSIILNLINKTKLFLTFWLSKRKETAPNYQHQCIYSIHGSYQLKQRKFSLQHNHFY